MSSNRGSIASLLELRERMNQLFDEMVHPLEPSSATATWTPVADVVETAFGFELSVELAGVEIEGVHVEVAGRIVTVRGVRGYPSESCEAVHRMERRYGPFVRSFELPAAATDEGLVRVHDEGVLRLTVRRV